MRRIELLLLDSLKFLKLYSLLQGSYSTPPTLHHRTSRVLEVLLEPKLGFTLVVCLGDNFGRANKIIHTPSTARIVLSPLRHKFGQCSEDPPLRYHALSSDVYGLHSDTLSTKFFLGSWVPLGLEVITMPCLYWSIASAHLMTWEAFPFWSPTN